MPETQKKEDTMAEGEEEPAARCPLCFNSPCLLEQGLAKSIMEYYETALCDDPDEGTTSFTSKEIRFRLYRHATSWMHGFLGKGRRIQLPTCVVGEIKDIAPADRGTEYVGFKDGNGDENNNND